MQKSKFKIKVLLLIFALLIVLAGCYFFAGGAPEQKNVTWGVNFSQMQAEALGLDWKKAYLALLEDLGAKNVKLHTQWDFVEGRQDRYYFDDIDWQIRQAEIHNAKIIFVTGMKAGRWPECHVPGWADGLPKDRQQKEILEYLQKVVERYQNSGAVFAWQVENEPLFNFGECPWYEREFLKKEVALVKQLDPGRPVVITDTGEQSFWFSAARIGDVVGVTTYRKAWAHIYKDFGFYVNFPLPAVSYGRRAWLVKKIFGKEVIGVELQAEPWLAKPFYGAPIGEQEKSMNLTQFKKNIAYAQKTGLDTFYLWGAEWWLWLKETQNKPEIWNEARTLFIH